MKPTAVEQIASLQRENKELNKRLLAFLDSPEGQNFTASQQRDTANRLADTANRLADELQKENDSLQSRLTEAEAALKLYADHKNWSGVVADSYSGELSVFDWPGELQDEPWEVAERALAATTAKEKEKE